MNRELFFESAGDERGTPQELYDQLNAEFNFEIDFAASKFNAKHETFFGPGGVADDALEQDWCGLTGFLNPPYSVSGAFVKKAREEADKGATVVQLLPVRTDNKWWHNFIWDKNAWDDNQRQIIYEINNHDREPEEHPKVPNGNWRPGVAGRFLPGRQQFTLYVPPEMRALVKEAFKHEDIDRKETIKQLIEVTGLPKMAIEGILKDYPDEDLLTSAPFPSCVVIFRKAA